jgi:hypothetical protein
LADLRNVDERICDFSDPDAVGTWVGEADEAHRRRTLRLHQHDAQSDTWAHVEPRWQNPAMLAADVLNFSADAQDCAISLRAASMVSANSL